MYSWISAKPYQHHPTFRVWFRTIDGRREYKTFQTEGDAIAFIVEAQSKLVKDGRPIEDVITAYLASLTTMRPSSLTTLRYRLKAVSKGRERLPIEAFPWAMAWAQVQSQSGDSQHGILAALQGLVAYAKLRGEPLAELKVSKARSGEGKPQLRISEAKTFIRCALAAGDPLAIAAATMAVTGLRSGEVMALMARDCDDGASVIWVVRGKTRKARRMIEVEPAFRPVLAAMTKGKAPGSPLFDYQPKGWRPNTNPAKARIDGLLRRVRQLCKAAGVDVVVPHSLRGLNATLRTLGGASHQAIADALGHESFSTTSRYYLDPGAAEQAASRRSHGRLLTAA